MTQRAAFLDRDGTIIEDVHFLTRPEDIRLLPGVASALKRLRDAGYLLIIVSNQSAVARGMIAKDEMWRIHGRLEELLQTQGVLLDAAYYCPHHPEGQAKAYAQSCGCRKPQPGMLLQAAAEHDIDLRRSAMVGDSERDIEAGRRAGCMTVLVRPGKFSAETTADCLARDLADAADLILDWTGRKCGRTPNLGDDDGTDQ